MQKPMGLIAVSLCGCSMMLGPLPPTKAQARPSATTSHPRDCKTLEGAATVDATASGVLVIGALTVAPMVVGVLALFEGLAGAGEGDSGSSTIALVTLAGAPLLAGMIYGGSAASGYKKADECRARKARVQRVKDELGLVPAPGGGWTVTRPSPLLSKLPRFTAPRPPASTTPTPSVSPTVELPAAAPPPPTSPPPPPTSPTP